jgi:hypothetical protein
MGVSRRACPACPVGVGGAGSAVPTRRNTKEHQGGVFHRGDAEERGGVSSDGRKLKSEQRLSTPAGQAGQALG